MESYEVLKFIKASLKKREIPPTIQEIARKFKFKSYSSVQYHLKKLKLNGKIRYRYTGKTKRRVARGIRVL